MEYYRKGLLYGTSCYRSDVFEAALNSSDEKLEQLLEFYDYVEIQPFQDYYHLIDRGQIESEENLIISINVLLQQQKN